MDSLTMDAEIVANLILTITQLQSYGSKNELFGILIQTVLASWAGSFNENHK